MNEIPTYPTAPKPPDPPQTAVERSVSRESAFSKPGTFGKNKSSPPAKGVRFRPTNEKSRGRQRKRKLDPRHVTFY